MSTAALTMVWNDNWFLDRWVRYFAKELGRDNIHVVLHGDDPTAREVAKGCNITCLPRENVGLDFDNERWEYLSEFASALSSDYDNVLTLDVDEVLIPSQTGMSLQESLDLNVQNANFCVPGFELFPHTPGSENYGDQQPIAAQCRTALFSPFYSKACISTGNVAFSPGGHGLLGQYPELRTDIALLHLRFTNSDELNRRRLLRENIADTAYEQNGVTLQEMRRTGRLVSWKEAQRRHRAVFQQMRSATHLEWTDAIKQTDEVLPKLRMEHGGRYQFKPTPEAPFKTDLPSWMSDRF